MTSFAAAIERYSAHDHIGGTDKGTCHSYTDLYERLFAPLRRRAHPDTPLRVMEIGVCTGASLMAFTDYFGDGATIEGIDVTLRSLNYELPEPRVQVFEMDATRPETASALTARDPRRFDVVLDDGSHDPDHQLQSLELFGPLIASNGVYVIEDIDVRRDSLLCRRLGDVADKLGLTMTWHDLRHVKGRADDIVAVFTHIHHPSPAMPPVTRSTL